LRATRWGWLAALNRTECDVTPLTWHSPAHGVMSACFARCALLSVELLTSFPQVATETARIKAAGGWVYDGRVCNVLAVSRAFGDWEFKVCVCVRMRVYVWWWGRQDDTDMHDGGYCEHLSGPNALAAAMGQGWFDNAALVALALGGCVPCFPPHPMQGKGLARMLSAGVERGYWPASFPPTVRFTSDPVIVTPATCDMPITDVSPVIWCDQPGCSETAYRMPAGKISLPQPVPSCIMPQRCAHHFTEPPATTHCLSTGGRVPRVVDGRLMGCVRAAGCHDLCPKAVCAWRHASAGAASTTGQWLYWSVLVPWVVQCWVGRQVGWFGRACIHPHAPL
jgi:hypothetical protein